MYSQIIFISDNATTEEARELVQEIEIMKQVGSHPNIVSMIGYISHNVQHGPILVVEYCPKGSLLSYLREIYTLIHYRYVNLLPYTCSLYEIIILGWKG